MTPWSNATSCSALRPSSDQNPTHLVQGGQLLATQLENEHFATLGCGLKLVHRYLLHAWPPCLLSLSLWTHPPRRCLRICSKGDYYSPLHLLRGWEDPPGIKPACLAKIANPTTTAPLSCLPLLSTFFHAEGQEGGGLVGSTGVALGNWGLLSTVWCLEFPFYSFLLYFSFLSSVLILA